MSIKLKITGFDDLMKDIEKAGGDIERITRNCLNTSAKIMQSELKQEMKESNVDKTLIDNMPAPEVENDYGKITARVGYKKGAYDPKNPSVGYKVVFMNYGTPYRKKHGKIKDVSDGGTIRLGFIDRAKKKAKKRIRKQQEKCLNDILKGLKR